jgi:radical SAM superfamily enzyme YgiQ (UPF0313 family)
MGLMKLATYYRRQGDDVRFFKGDLKDLAANLFCENFLQNVKETQLHKYISNIRQYIKTGKDIVITSIPQFQNPSIQSKLHNYRNLYKEGKYPQFDIICITTLFTFYWKETIATINEAKKFCCDTDKIKIGGIAATLLSDYVFEETQIRPVKGLLNRRGILDGGNKDIIDELPLDYSILEESNYKYPADNAYFAYMTRGCVNKCQFCAVPKLEPKYKNYIGLSSQIEETNIHYGSKKDLLLMDNNVFASNKFNLIIDEIKNVDFKKVQLISLQMNTK